MFLKIIFRNNIIKFREYILKLLPHNNFTENFLHIAFCYWKYFLSAMFGPKSSLDTYQCSRCCKLRDADVKFT